MPLFYDLWANQSLNKNLAVLRYNFFSFYSAIGYMHFNAGSFISICVVDKFGERWR